MPGRERHLERALELVVALRADVADLLDDLSATTAQRERSLGALLDGGSDDRHVNDASGARRPPGRLLGRLTGEDEVAPGALPW